MGFPPRLIMIGAQKAGTTTLAMALAQHPDITLGLEKEPDYYTRFYGNGPNWYRENYPDYEARWLLDASTSYSSGFIDKRTMRPFAVAERILETVADPRLIYILRDPVDRAYSSYWHARRYGNERRPPREAITPDSIYVKQSCYVQHLGYFLRSFTRRQILVLDFNDLCKNPLNVVHQVTDFLDIEPLTTFDMPSGSAKNKGFQYSPLASLTMRLFSSNSHFRDLLSRGKQWTPAFLKPLATNILTRDIPPISSQERARLAQIFEPGTRALEVVLSRRFPHWKRPVKVTQNTPFTPSMSIYPHSSQDILAP